MATMEDNINTILEIMISRNQPVGRFWFQSFYVHMLSVSQFQIDYIVNSI
jgi:hypothetical protein